MICPNCGEDTVVWLEHHDYQQSRHHPDCPEAHSYCRNCDYGLCCEEC